MSKVFDFHEENPDVQEWQSYLSVLPTVDNFVLDASRIFDDLQRLSPHLFGKRFEVLVSDTIQGKCFLLTSMVLLTTISRF